MYIIWLSAKIRVQRTLLLSIYESSMTLFFIIVKKHVMQATISQCVPCVTVAVLTGIWNKVVLMCELLVCLTMLLLLYLLYSCLYGVSIIIGFWNRYLLCNTFSSVLIGHEVSTVDCILNSILWLKPKFKICICWICMYFFFCYAY